MRDPPTELGGTEEHPATPDPRACVSAAFDHGADRARYGGPIASFPPAQQKLAAMALEVSRATLLAHHLGRMKDSCRPRPGNIGLGEPADAGGVDARPALGATRPRPTSTRPSSTRNPRTSTRFAEPPSR
ncbi:acyl-CoA dehydrogenase family protein [Spongiactinospora gelatinilytica]|uniref:acyl-CoA dehydrogenase family protein n=1 Tax=Spongiactinospora gelatinilytica TaxID=2666298 RepID=UPI000DA791AE